MNRKHHEHRHHNDPVDEGAAVEAAGRSGDPAAPRTAVGWWPSQDAPG